MEGTNKVTSNLVQEEDMETVASLKAYIVRLKKEIASLKCNDHNRRSPIQRSCHANMAVESSIVILCNAYSAKILSRGD
jgi:hypothetical protein